MQEAHYRIPGILNASSIGILKAHVPLTLESNMQRLAHRKHWHPARQSSHTVGFLLVVAVEGLYYWSNIS
jgi:hypothetical protein